MTTMQKFILFSMLLLMPTLSFPQESDVNTIVRNKKKKSAFELFSKDTLDTRLPSSGAQTTPAQDSAYYQALRTSMPVSLRLRYDLLNASYAVISLDPETGKTGLDYLPAEVFNPEPNQIVQRQENLMRAFEVPYARTYNPYGVKVSFADIGKFFGLTEDYSGKMQFKVDKYTKVEIVIYSIQATVVATIFEGYLPEGTYQRTWTGRDSNGRKLPPGDYIGEVRISGERSIRKRIILH